MNQLQNWSVKPSKGQLLLLLLFLPTSTKLHALKHSAKQGMTATCLIGVKSVKEGDRISPLEGYTYEAEKKAVDEIGCKVCQNECS